MPVTPSASAPTPTGSSRPTPPLSQSLRGLEAQASRTERAVTTLASLILPGAGQLLQGRLLEGFLFLALCPVLLATTQGPGLLLANLAAALEASVRYPSRP